MGLSIHLLGRPRVIRDGIEIEARGRKVWALLAYLLLSDHPRQRTDLARLLFSEAEDPLRALRWNLTQLRQVVGVDVHGSDEIALELPPDARVDAMVLTTGTWAEAMAIPDLGRDLLEGMDFSRHPYFEPWLMHERRHLMACGLAILREAANAQLASGDPEAAIASSTRAVALDPLDEESQALLIRCYASSGDRRAAERQMSSYSELCRIELDAEPGEIVTSALDAGPRSGTGPPVVGAAAVRAQMEAGRAAIKAGVLDSGLDCLKRAAAEAGSCRDHALEAEVMGELGSALAHAGRDRHSEASACLHAALERAREVGIDRIAASSQLELAWIEFMAARYERADQWVRGALEDGTGDPAIECIALWIRGKSAMERGRFARSVEDLSNSVELAGELNDSARRSFCYASLARTLLLKRDLGGAKEVADEAIRVAEVDGFNWVLPLPLAFRAEVALIEGDLGLAGELLDRSYASALQVGDRSFETAARRGLGLLKAEHGRLDDAISELESAYLKLASHPDCEWVLAYVLDALCDVAARARKMDPRWLADLESLAARTGMRQMLTHVYLYRHRLGVPGAIDTAVTLAAEVDNDHLHAVLEDEASLGGTGAGSAKLKAVHISR